ncbi:hypothetical protein PaG_03035 [Moesziomyces aphidis]|uniref:Uncharacterized protein n=1 Tax=Moesziomyces aphidis TaxID=84754 RepID=W3VNR3_MOEAP|nr:hypothetical protein PaG_03035 [Moesziomyces aphidis]
MSYERQQNDAILGDLFADPTCRSEWDTHSPHVWWFSQVGSMSNCGPRRPSRRPSTALFGSNGVRKSRHCPLAPPSGLVDKAVWGPSATVGYWSHKRARLEIFGHWWKGAKKRADIIAPRRRRSSVVSLVSTQVVKKMTDTADPLKAADRREEEGGRESTRGGIPDVRGQIADRCSAGPMDGDLVGTEEPSSLCDASTRKRRKGV